MIKKLLCTTLLVALPFVATAQRSTLTSLYPFSQLTNHAVDLNSATLFIQATNDVALRQSTNRSTTVSKETTIIMRTVQDRTLFFNASWVWIGNTNAVAPATLASNKTYVFKLHAYGGSETNVTISYGKQQ